MRKAIYNSDRSRRIVSVPGNLWQAQIPSGQPATDTHSGWLDVGRPHAIDRAKIVARINTAG